MMIPIEELQNRLHRSICQYDSIWYYVQGTSPHFEFKEIETLDTRVLQPKDLYQDLLNFREYNLGYFYVLDSGIDYCHRLATRKNKFGIHESNTRLNSLLFGHFVHPNYNKACMEMLRNKYREFDKSKNSNILDNKLLVQKNSDTGKYELFVREIKIAESDLPLEYNIPKEFGMIFNWLKSKGIEVV